MNEALDLVIALIKRFEGCRLVAYQDQVGIWTIGYGETLGVKPGDRWTQELAESKLRQRAMYFLLQAYQKCPQLHNEPPDRVAACVSLEYNIGVGAFGVSSVTRKTKRKEYIGAGDAFLLWIFARGHEIAGLKYRRTKERLIYLGCGL